jgi:hypothetical protein
MSRNILQGLVGAWCPSLGPSGYTLLDRSGRGQNASMQNFSALPWSASPGGWEASFAASSTNRALCSRPVLSGTGDFTISAWVNPISLSGTASEFFIAGNYGSGNLTGVEFYGYNGKLNIYVTSTFVASTSALIAGVYTFVACTRKGGAITLYQSGLADATGTLSGSIGSARNWSVGNGPDYTAGHGGRIDDQGVWNRALTAPEVWQLYQSGRGGLGRLLTPQRRSYAFRVPAAAVKSYLFTNRGQVIGGGTL